MSRLLWSLAVLVCSGWSASAADGPVDIKAEVRAKCGLPPLGVVELNGATATRDEMEEGKLQVVTFMAASDMFQDCVRGVKNIYKGKLTAQDQTIADAIAEENQKEKESVGAAYNAAVDSFNVAHPKKPASSPAKH